MHRMDHSFPQIPGLVAEHLLISGVSISILAAVKPNHLADPVKQDSEQSNTMLLLLKGNVKFLIGAFIKYLPILFP